MTDSSETAPNAPSGETLPRTRPPQDPEAFARWLGLETLKADLKRLELEKLRYAQMEEMRAAPPPLPPAPETGGGRTIAALALVLALALAGLGGYLAVQLNALNGEVARLSMAQADLRDAVQAMDAQANAAEPTAAPAAPPSPGAASISSSAPQLSWTPPAPVETAPTPTETINVTPPTPAADANSAPAAAPPAEPAPEAFTVRVFASANPAAKAKREAFASTVRAAGFTVDVSDMRCFSLWPTPSPSTPPLLRGRKRWPRRSGRNIRTSSSRLSRAR
jgi:hypothetical protein